jgi:hypothetical protein
MPLKCPFCGHDRIIVKQTVSYYEEYEYNTGDTEFEQPSCQRNFETEGIYCQKCKEKFNDIEEVKQAQTTTFRQFKKAIAKHYEDFAIGYQEQPTEQDLKDLYKDFLESCKTLDEYSKDC